MAFDEKVADAFNKEVEQLLARIPAAVAEDLRQRHSAAKQARQHYDSLVGELRKKAASSGLESYPLWFDWFLYRLATGELADPTGEVPGMFNKEVDQLVARIPAVVVEDLRQRDLA